MFLLDTNIVSALRRPRPHGGVVAWVRSVNSADLFISAVTIGELQAGVELVRPQNPAKAAELEYWIGRITEMHHVLSMDARIFRRWAQLMYRRTTELSEDAMIAATADVHNLVVATRNIKDFAQLGAKTFNPFDMPREES